MSLLDWRRLFEYWCYFEKKKIQVSTLKSLNKVRLIQSSNTFLLVYKDWDVKMFNLIYVEFYEELEH